ncbi:MAG: site-specific DNA-methyltransferase [Phycisphaerae bacterium]|nr:site-specific DNA-methyltransferase [Phycisphaerae bacterium]
MPTLDWIGKKAVVGHHKEVPFHLLRCNRELSVGDPGSGNLLVQGDNLVALKALLPHYGGQVKCIYIDPPYNTGDESWVYNDNVRSPEIEEWIGHVVGRETDDLSRHDKWLCMMYPRLSLLRLFLREDGVLFVSIDENEEGYLRLLMDEIFGRHNALGTLVWKRRSSSAMRGTPLSVDHEYVLCYATNARSATLYGLEKGIESYPHVDERGHYASTDLTVGMSREARPGQYYPITNPRTGRVYQPNPERVWRFYPQTMKAVIADGLIIWPDDVGGKMERPRYKTYYDPNTDKPKPVSSWIESAGGEKGRDAEQAEYDLTILSSGMNQEGGRLLQQLLGTKAFAYPKPMSLVMSLLRAATKNDDIVLDSFAGSGTTGHAVLSLNQQDAGRRRFVLVEMEQDISRQITTERLGRACRGYARPDGRRVQGLGGGFRYCELGPPLFDADGQIRAEVSFAELAQHVFFMETGEPLPKRATARSPLLGVAKGTAVYLLYNGILRDKDPRGGNVLTSALLKTLPKHDGPKIIYGTSCRISVARLDRERITFRQIPYEVRVS